MLSKRVKERIRANKFRRDRNSPVYFMTTKDVHAVIFKSTGGEFNVAEKIKIALLPRKG